MSESIDRTKNEFSKLRRIIPTCCQIVSLPRKQPPFTVGNSCTLQCKNGVLTQTCCATHRPSHDGRDPKLAREFPAAKSAAATKKLLPVFLSSACLPYRARTRFESEEKTFSFGDPTVRPETVSKVCTSDRSQLFVASGGRASSRRIEKRTYASTCVRQTCRHGAQAAR